jgi:type III pantothenate kinase
MRRREQRVLLAIDLGNTNLMLGVYRDEDLIAHWRLTTRRNQTSDEYGILIKNLFLHGQIDTQAIDGIIISSVVPPLLPALQRMTREYFHIEPIVVEATLDVGMPILYDDAKEVGADRIVNAVAAFRKFGGPLIVIDFGTATTFEAISERGEYLGGAIVPGIMISMEALFQQAAKLPRIELTTPHAVIGKNTVESMQAGMIYGYAALVDGIVARMRDEMGGAPTVVATGGQAGLVASETKLIGKVDPYLTLDGLKMIYDRLRP